LRLAQALVVALLSATAYAQDADRDTMDQAHSVWESVASKYQFGVSSNPPLFAQLDKAIVKSKLFEGAYRASKAVLTGGGGGVTYRNYGTLIQPLLAEASIVKDAATTPDEQLLAQAYSDAADVYAAVGRFWSVALRHPVFEIAGILPYPWSVAQLVVNKANDAYLRNYRAEMAPTPTPTPTPTPKRPKRAGARG
jgi:hypothetical protein